MAAVIRFVYRHRALLAMLVLFSGLLSILLVLSAATENSTYFDQLYSPLLAISSLGLLVMAVLIAYSLIRLLRRYRRQEPGTHLTVRLAMLLVVIAIAPVSIVYYFSFQFLQRGIDSWFDVQVEAGLDNALELSRSALGLRMREVLKQSTRAAEDLIGVSPELAPLRLGQALNDNDASEWTLFGQGNRIIATASLDATSIVPSYPPEGILLHVRQGHDYVSLEPNAGAGFQIRTLVQIPQPDSTAERYLLQALYPVPERLGDLADSVQAAFDGYKGLSFLRRPLKTSFILTLSMVLLLSVLAAIWIALYLARRLVAPIRDLAEGTHAVAAGRYDQQLTQSGKDELGFLVQSFNQMTRHLAQARDATERSQRIVEQQRTYLQVVLARLSSGVLTLDQEACLRTYNAAADQILGIALAPFLGQPLNVLAERHPELQAFCDAITPRLGENGDDWRQEITVFSGGSRQLLTCRGSSLPDSVDLTSGHVIVFDDITYLVQAERDAAWAEVARRLAHEIKNPLTPIQLSAERIRHKYLRQMNAEEARVLDRGTHTIIQQVQAMKEMVDTFNEYARPGRLQLLPLNLNEFINEVLYLYHDHPTDIAIHLDLDPVDIWIEADKGRLRQLLHNLIKNAIEAVQDGKGTQITVATRSIRDVGGEMIDLSFTDDGPGFPSQDIGDIFEPYVTTKPKGSGLGLAIVKKIVEEHGGQIRLESCSSGGARVVIRFPACRPLSKAATANLSSHEETG